MGVATAMLPLAGGTGTGQIGVATAMLPLAGGTGTGQMGVATAMLPLAGGTGTGQMGVVTFPPVRERTALPLTGLAKAPVNKTVKSVTNPSKRKFNTEQDI